MLPETTIFRLSSVEVFKQLVVSVRFVFTWWHVEKVPSIRDSTTFCIVGLMVQFLYCDPPLCHFMTVTVYTHACVANEYNFVPAKLPGSIRAAMWCTGEQTGIVSCCTEWSALLYTDICEPANKHVTQNIRSIAWFCCDSRVITSVCNLIALFSTTTDWFDVVCLLMHRHHVQCYVFICWFISVGTQQIKSFCSYLHQEHYVYSSVCLMN